MNADETDTALLGLLLEGRGSAAYDLSFYDCAMFEELSFVRREAQREADIAYEEWRRSWSRDAYAVYVAARDRADAAQDQLANWVRRFQARTMGS
jgi:hypothetical protein